MAAALALRVLEIDELAAILAFEKFQRCVSRAYAVFRPTQAVKFAPPAPAAMPGPAILLALCQLLTSFRRFLARRAWPRPFPLKRNYKQSVFPAA